MNGSSLLNKHKHANKRTTGVHITYEDLYNAIVFLSCIYVAGIISSRVFRMPNLVGEILSGILLGPPLLDLVPFAEGTSNVTFISPPSIYVFCWY